MSFAALVLRRRDDRQPAQILQRLRQGEDAGRTNAVIIRHEDAVARLTGLRRRKRARRPERNNKRNDQKMQAVKKARHAPEGSTGRLPQVASINARARGGWNYARLPK